MSLLRLYLCTFQDGSGKSYPLFPKKCVCRIKKAKSLDALFILLSGYWDFQNYHLLEFLIKRFGDEPLRESLKKYQRDLNEFQTTTKLAEYMRTLPFGDSKGMQLESDKMIVKLPLSWSTSKLDVVEEFHKKFCASFSIPLHVMRFKGAEKGCISLTWLVPADPILSAAPTALQFLPVEQFSIEICDQTEMTELSVPSNSEKERSIYLQYLMTLCCCRKPKVDKKVLKLPFWKKASNRSHECSEDQRILPKVLEAENDMACGSTNSGEQVSSFRSLHSIYSNEKLTHP